MKKEFLDIIKGGENNYLELENKLLAYNQENSTDYEITHNGLELWINLSGKPEKQNNDIVKIISMCGFKTPNMYGYKYYGHLLWVNKTNN